MDLLSPLLPARFRPYAKAWFAAVGAVLSVLALTLTDVTWLPVLVNILTVLGVYASPANTTPTPEVVPVSQGTQSLDEAF